MKKTLKENGSRSWDFSFLPFSHLLSFQDNISGTQNNKPSQVTGIKKFENVALTQELVIKILEEAFTVLEKTSLLTESEKYCRTVKQISDYIAKIEDTEKKIQCPQRLRSAITTAIASAQTHLQSTKNIAEYKNAVEYLNEILQAHFPNQLSYTVPAAEQPSTEKSATNNPVPADQQTSTSVINIFVERKKREAKQQRRKTTLRVESLTQDIIQEQMIVPEELPEPAVGNDFLEQFGLK